MRIPATDSALLEVNNAIRAWQPGDEWVHRPKVNADERWHLVLPPHAHDIYFALHLRSHDLEAAKRQLASSTPPAGPGVFLYRDQASVEAGLRTRWHLDSIEDAWVMMQNEVVKPVLRKFVAERGGAIEAETMEDRLDRLDLPSVSECVEWLAFMVIPETAPPHPQAWLPNPQVRLRAYWKKALTNDVIDGLRSVARRENPEGTHEVRLDTLDLDDLACLPGVEVVTTERLELLDVLSYLGSDRVYLDPDVTPESIGVSPSTYYDRRNRTIAKLAEIRPDLASRIPRRRNFSRDHPE